MASARVNGRSLFALIIGLKIRSMKPLLVWLALRTRIDEMVQGSVELESI